ncbi:hypothetical protein MKX01_040639 [Papaver californicum]|nr:hypothetical protein MKX01_040639 [Papaver californicum]
MGLFTIQNPWVLTFGLLGNIISLMVYLAPVPTFYRIYKKKTTEGFQSLPYVVASFSSMLWIYYAFLKSDATFLITINSVGCVIETIYLTMYMAYAARKARLPNILGFIFGMGQMILYVFYKGAKQPKIVEDEINTVVEITSIVDTNATLTDVTKLKEILSDGQIIIVSHNNIEDVQEQLAKKKNIGGAILYQHQNVIEV